MNLSESKGRRVILKKGCYALFLTGLFSYFLLLCSLNSDHIFFEGKIYFVDPDSYTRMYHAKLLDQLPSWPLKIHSFENAPFGIKSNETSLFEYMVVSLKRIFGFFKYPSPLDLAGAWISPIIGLFSFFYLWWWSRRYFQGSARWMLLIGFLFSPPIIAAFQLGHPDYQGLMIFFLLVFLTSTYRWVTLHLSRNEADPRSSVAIGHMQIAAALGLGFALWTSFFEPLIIGVFTLCIVFIHFRLKLKSARIFGMTIGMVLLLMLLVGGWRLPVSDFSGEMTYRNWSTTIGGMSRLGWSSVNHSFGWLFWISPLLLIHSFRKREIPRTYHFFFGGLFVLCLILSFISVRWLSLSALLYILTIPPLLGAMNGRVWKWILFLILLYPCMRYLSAHSASKPGQESMVVQQADLRYLTQVIPQNKNLVILAPWWWSPHILYWTGNPVVAGSSFKNIEGIVDSARFYSSLKNEEAYEILRSRNVSVVVGYDAPRTLANSLGILGFKDITDVNVIDTDGYAFSVASQLMDEMREDYSALDGHLFMHAYSGPLTKYQFRVFWVLDPDKNP